MAEFSTILTTVGLAKMANATVTQSPIQFTSLAVGDSNGSYYTPTSDQTALKHEVWRGNISSVYVDDSNANWIVIESVIPSNIGGFTIREVGLFDTDGDLIAVGKYPATYKPVLDDGSTKDIYLRVIIEVANTSAITLKIDPSVALASKEYVTKAIEKLIPKTDIENVISSSTTKVASAASVKLVDDKVTSHQTDLAHVHWIGTATGTNTLTATYAPITEYKEGLAVSFKNTTASTAATTLNINGLGGIPIINSDGEAQSELKANGVYTVRYSNGNFILQGSSSISKSAQISNLNAISNFSTSLKIEVSWTNPSDGKFKGVRIVYKAGSYPSGPYDGTLAYQNTTGTASTNATIASGINRGTTYYFRAFAFTYQGDKFAFTTSTVGAQTSVLATQPQGIVNFTTSQTWTVPTNVTSIDIFLAGGGGGGGIYGSVGGSSGGGGGGGGGYTKNYYKIPVTPGQSIPVVVGAGGEKASTYSNSGGSGGSSSVVVNGATYYASGGYGGKSGSSTSNFSSGGSGGSGGGSGNMQFGSGYNYMSYPASSGGYDGSASSNGYYSASGQLTTTRSFETGSYYSGGGGGEGSPSGSGGIGGGGNGGYDGTPNTGGGGGGNAKGGSGAVIIRWGY